MTKLKGFKKHRNELSVPVIYEVVFSSGVVVEVMAKSSRDAEIKTINLQTLYGFFMNATRKK